MRRSGRGIYSHEEKRRSGEEEKRRREEKRIRGERIKGGERPFLQEMYTNSSFGELDIGRYADGICGG